MDSLEAKMRFKVVVGKFPVIKVEQHGRVLDWWVELPNRVVIKITGPHADVKEGDLLTFYTEVIANAEPSPTSIQ
jgi:hypothetical protein